MSHGRTRLLTSATTLVAGLAALAGATPALAGATELVRIAVAPNVHSGSVYNMTLLGQSQRRVRAYLFVDYSGCARSFGVERQRNPDAFDSYRVQGSFSEISGWRSSAPGTDHACAYLVAAGGRVLARSRLTYHVG
jgi:hypothetical protein